MEGMDKPAGLRLKRSLLRPIQVLPLGFFLIILLGTGLLMLPAASTDGPLPFFDALFTATSATCVTGLVVADTGLDFTGFGQAVILLLIQVGGLGFMSMAALLFRALGRRVSLTERLVMAEAMNADRLQGVLELVLRAVKITAMIELAGAALLAVRFVPQMGAAKGLWFALFHAVSAFCNAGFDLMGNYASLTGYVGDPYVNLIVMALIVLGGLGFTVIADCCGGRNRRFPLHGKLVLTITGILIVLGALLTLLLEWSNPATLGPLSTGDKVLAGFFQSVTLRTAGFNTIDQGSLRDATKFLSVVLMFIGASPAGTGGGVKTTTVALLLLGVWSVIKNREDINLFRRRIPWGLVRRALAITTILLAAVLLTTILLLAIEVNGPAGSMGLADMLYESASAYGTAGLSVGVTAVVSPLSRVLLMLGMFMGRVGPLTLALSFGGRGDGKTGLRYPEAQLMIG